MCLILHSQITRKLNKTYKTGFLPGDRAFTDAMHRRKCTEPSSLMKPKSQRSECKEAEESRICGTDSWGVWKPHRERVQESATPWSVCKKPICS